jgi:hypothetical protein
MAAMILAFKEQLFKNNLKSLKKYTKESYKNLPIK